VVGHSYGALTALFLAAWHPELIRRLVLCEAPAVSLLDHCLATKVRLGRRPSRHSGANGDQMNAEGTFSNSSERNLNTPGRAKTQTLCVDEDLMHVQIFNPTRPTHPSIGADIFINDNHRNVARNPNRYFSRRRYFFG
jgi:pimeloyl-ACP methyl ester carboxylesterase